MKNILLLGGTGFIGKNVIDYFLCNSNVNIIIVARNINRLDENNLNSKRITIKKGSISDFNFIKNIIIDYNVDVVVHLISSIISSSSSEDFYEEMENVIIPTFRIIDFICNDKVKFIFFSSGGTIYGKSNVKLHESNSLQPINYYGHSKLIIEDYIKFKNRTSNLLYLIIRPSNVFGKYQRVISQQGFIAVATHKILNKELLEIWGDGNAKRDFIDVYDLTEVLYSLLKMNVTNKIINVGSGTSTKIIDLVRLIEEKLNLRANLVYKNKRIVDLDEMVLCIDELEKYIKFSPRPIDQSIGLFIETLKE